MNSGSLLVERKQNQNNKKSSNLLPNHLCLEGINTRIMHKLREIILILGYVWDDGQDLFA